MNIQLSFKIYFIIAIPNNYIYNKSAFKENIGILEARLYQVVYFLLFFQLKTFITREGYVTFTTNAFKRFPVYACSILNLQIKNICSY